MKHLPPPAITNHPTHAQVCASKFRYKSKADAVVHLVKRRRTRTSKRGHFAGPLRPYNCPNCHGWHLTSNYERGSK